MADTQLVLVRLLSAGKTVNDSKKILVFPSADREYFKPYYDF